MKRGDLDDLDLDDLGVLADLASDPDALGDCDALEAARVLEVIAGLDGLDLEMTPEDRERFRVTTADCAGFAVTPGDHEHFVDDLTTIMRRGHGVARALKIQAAERQRAARAS